MDAKPDELKPPYLPFSTFLAFLTELGSKPLPPQIDRSMMISKSGTDQGNLFAALKYFDLIDHDLVVQQGLRGLVAAGDEERKSAIGAMFHQKYPRQFEVSKQHGTEKLLLDSFEEEWGYTGDTRRKAMTFFLQGARWAGISLSAHFPTTRMGSGRPAGPRAKRTIKKKAPASGAAERQARQQGGVGERVVVHLGAAGSVEVDVNVRWLELPDATFSDLRRIIQELRDLGSEEEPEEPDDEVSTS